MCRRVPSLSWLDAFKRSQSVPNVARHLELIVEGSAYHTLGVYDVGHPGGAESEYALNVVQTPDFPGCVARKLVRNPHRVAEVVRSIYAVGAYANDYGVKPLQLVVGFAETPHLDCSTASEGANEEEQNDIPASMLRKGEWFARTERDSEVRGLRIYL